jgi:hypothetical protein
MVGEILGDCGWFWRNKRAGEKMEVEKTKREKE